jgi:prevent-host-death family protein
MKIVNIHEAKTKLSALLAEVEATGEKVLICRHGKPIADLVPHRKRRRLEPHPVMSKIRIDYDPTEPLAEDEWPESRR